MTGSIFATKMASFGGSPNDVYLVFGAKTGWIGQQIVVLLQQRGRKYFVAESRTENRADIVAEVERTGAPHVINAAGVTGRPNVDWCEVRRHRRHRRATGGGHPVERNADS